MTDFPFERTDNVHPAGTVLVVRVYGIIHHYGIATGYGTVIHASRRLGRVEESDMVDFSDGRRAVVVPYAHSATGSEIVSRARLRKGQRYNVAINNCEHFITWAIEGRARSPQLGPADGRRLMR